MQDKKTRTRQVIFRYLLITALAMGIAIALRLIANVNQTTAALSFLVLILVTATRWRLAYSVYLSILCTLLYNFYFLPPIGTLTISDPENWVALLAFLSTSVLVSHLAESEHRHTTIAETRRLEVERLYEFSQQLLMHDDLRSLARNAPSLAAAIFGFSAVALYVREDDVAYYSDPHNEMLPALDLKNVAHSGETDSRLKEGVRVIALVLGMRPLGALAVTGQEYSDAMVEAIGGLVAIALERASALERTSRIEASREGEKLRSALLDSVTHDLRTPLTAIRAAATTMVSHPALPAAERAEMLAVVDEESARLDRLIGQAIEMAQLDAATVQVNRKPQDLREVIELSLEEAQPLLHDRQIEVHIPENLQPMAMDRELVRRVLRHLIENAVKYSPSGSPISLSARAEAEKVLVTVADHGPGIDETEQPFIFEKFFRGKRQRQRVQGTGMGLAIVKAILEAHGGGIEVTSKPGKGSDFTFWLPLQAPEQPD